MFKLIKKLFLLLDIQQKRRLYILQILIVLMAFTEILGVASIVPFMTLVGDMTQLKQDTVLGEIYRASGVSSESQFVFLMGILVLLMLLLSAVISMFTTWRLAMFATRTGSEISDRLFSYYLNQTWLFHVSGSSAQLVKKIAVESNRVTSSVLQPFLQLNARVALALFMGAAIFTYDPKVACVGLLMFTLAYLILYKVVRSRLQRNGKLISSVLEQRFRLMNGAFGGIEDVLLLGCQQGFIEPFEKNNTLFATSQGENTALAQVPRYFMELIAFGSMIALVLYLIINHDGNLGLILPILSVYALAGFKLLPAFQLIYGSVAQIKGNIPAFEAIHQDLINSKTSHSEQSYSDSKEKLSPKNTISLKNITFTYPGKTLPALKQLNMQIAANSIVGVVGQSGSGKSTLMYVLLGLLQSQNGSLEIDGQLITGQNLRTWQNTIGYVPQSIFLSEGTIAENVAFGVAEKDINFDKVQEALRLAHLKEFIQSLDLGVHTNVGERGVELSGGQRQRVGIARALYHEAEVLVFDEATSALDGITEKLIMEAIHDFSGQKTIVLVAHRLKTVQGCDQIFFLDKGQVVDKGSYNKLIETNKLFKHMAEHS